MIEVAGIPVLVLLFIALMLLVFALTLIAMSTDVCPYNKSCRYFSVNCLEDYRRCGFYKRGGCED